MHNICIYKFKSGIRKGRFCNKIAIGFNLCRQHLVYYCKLLLKHKHNNHDILNCQNLKNKSSEEIVNIYNVLITQPKNKIEKISPERNFCKLKSHLYFDIRIPRIYLTRRSLKFNIHKDSNNLKNIKLRYKNDIISVPNIINKKWKIIKMLGEGGYGKIFSCYDITDVSKKERAIKLEHINSKVLIHETNMYLTMINNKMTKFIPKLFTFGVDGKIRFLVIEKLNPIKEYQKNKKTVSKILIILKTFAENGMSHGDVKFDNIMRRDNDDIVIIDFGFTRFINEHVKVDDIYGTPMYMSILTHCSELGLRNDLESLFYCLCENKRKLPWDNDNVKSLRMMCKLKIEMLESIVNRDKNVLDYFYLSPNDYISKLAVHIMELTTKDFPRYKIPNSNKKW
ncbi:serine/threonine protein kinase 2 [Dasineura jujubifolia toursvirus 2a]|nr:serine/threonine protein kinase 2 [Dasineura jujubifolia toursvirus 2a]